jgi:PAS domain-containing protein
MGEIHWSVETCAGLVANNPVPMWMATRRHSASSMSTMRPNSVRCSREFLAMTIADICPGADRTRLQENLKGERARLEQAGEWRHRRKDGVVLDVDVTSHSFVADGRSVVLVTAHDVSARKQVERDLMYSERRFRAVAQSAREGIVIADITGAIVFCNPAAAELFGYEHADMLGRPLASLMPERYRTTHVEGRPANGWSASRVEGWDRVSDRAVAFVVGA